MISAMDPSAPSWRPFLLKIGGWLVFAAIAWGVLRQFLPGAMRLTITAALALGGIAAWLDDSALPVARAEWTRRGVALALVGGAIAWWLWFVPGLAVVRCSSAVMSTTVSTGLDRFRD